MGHQVAASSIASVRFSPCHVKSSGIALSSSTCAPVFRSSPPSVVWSARWGRIRAGPSLHSWLGVPLGSIVVSQGEPPFRLEFAFGVLWDAADPRLGCFSPVCVKHESAVWWCAPRSAGSWSSRCQSSCLCFFVALQPFFSCFDLRLRMIVERVRNAGPSTCSAGCLLHRCLS